MGNDGNPQQLKVKVEALQLSVEGLFKLLGSGDPDKKLQFRETLKGITSRADFLLVEHELTQMNTLVSQVTASARTIAQSAKETGGGAGVAKAGH